MYQKSVKAGSQSGIGQWSEEPAGDEDIMKKLNETQSEENTNNSTTAEENGKESLTNTLENNLCQHHANQVSCQLCSQILLIQKINFTILQLVAQKKSKLGDSCDKSLMAEVGGEKI